MSAGKVLDVMGMVPTRIFATIGIKAFCQLKQIGRVIANTGMLPGDGFIALKCPECGVR